MNLPLRFEFYLGQTVTDVKTAVDTGATGFLFHQRIGRAFGKSAEIKEEKRTMYGWRDPGSSIGSLQDRDGYSLLLQS